MIFLVHYNRTAGTIVELTPFADRDLASEAKLNIEIGLLSCSNGHEVVLLEADDEESLRRTHSRYFNALRDMKAQKSV